MEIMALNWKKTFQWGFVAILATLIGASAINRLAGLFYLKDLKTEDTVYQFTQKKESVDGITIQMDFVREGSPYYSPVMSADYTIFVVTITNNGKSFIDYQPMDFYMELPGSMTSRPFDQSEISEALSSSLLGTAMAPGTMARLNRTRKMVDQVYLPPARVFPNYSREGIVAFPLIRSRPDSFDIRLTQLSINGKILPPIIFQIKKLPAKATPQKS
jgi:hypothetical protein